MNKYLRLVLGITILSGLIYVFRSFEVPDCFEIQARVNEWGVLAPLMFGLLYVVATVAFIPGLLVTLMAGLAFGAWWGTVIVAISATIGACVSFLIARYFARDAISGLLNRQQWFKKFATSTEENAFSFVLFTRLVPIFPFNGLNYACGLVPIGFKSYAIASFIGMLPGTFAYVYLGATGCKVIDAVQTGELTFGSLPEHVRNSLLTAIVLLGTLSLLPLVLKKFRKSSKPSNV